MLIMEAMQMNVKERSDMILESSSNDIISISIKVFYRN